MTLLPVVLMVGVVLCTGQVMLLMCHQMKSYYHLILLTSCFISSLMQSRLMMDSTYPIGKWKNVKVFVITIVY